ncbi:bacterioferritin [Radicibacter daui]|uniref:bacterioferritin n=1 Tax=Radicibacter daui TaxID=3064829 RepID=UPI004046FB1F
MKGDKKVIEHLNRILTNELTATNQYFLHARMLKDWGINELADYVYHESIGEMRHADLMIQRILFLEGLPNVQDISKIHIGENVKEMMECDLKVESKNRDDLREAIPYTESVRDFPSRDVLSKILDDTEEHIDWLETQLSLIERLGEKAYVQQRLGEVGSSEH